MSTLIRPVLELTVILPGMLLAYLPVRTYLKQAPRRLACWLIPLLLGICFLEGTLCFFLKISTIPVLFLTLPFLMVIYHKTLQISIWKSGSISLAIYAVFACVNSLSRAINAIMTVNLDPSRNELWFHTGPGILYNLICLAFTLAAWYPATHSVRTMIEDKNFAKTWYVFWILPLIFVGLNLFMIPKYQNTLYTGRVLQIYIVLSLVLLVILVPFYAMFLLMASSLNKNARLQQENHLLSLQQARYENLCTAIEEARQARHDIRHHFLQLSALAQNGDLEKIKEYLSLAISKVPDSDLHFCENQAADSVMGYYLSLAKRENIPFHAKMDIPVQIPLDKVDMCLVLSNLLENAIQASLKTEPLKRKINVEIYLPYPHLLLIQVENTYSGEIRRNKEVLYSTSHSGQGIGTASVCKTAEKYGGYADFYAENGIFRANVFIPLENTGGIEKIHSTMV